VVSVASSKRSRNEATEFSFIIDEMVLKNVGLPLSDNPTLQPKHAAPAILHIL